MGFGAALRKIFPGPQGDVRPDEVAGLLAGGAVLLDVREPDEWHAGRAPQARHIPLGELAARVDELPADRPVLAVCRSGVRSARAVDALRGRGRRARNVAGGMRAWADAGLPVVAEDGGAGTVI